ncbi:MAG: penicillin-binding protein [Elusimicrobia bacterium CG06_land_8_20_14_3_00_38_11]|nr:MAG: penicillin-binding protein [Elusimicrobia bacterium CG06_land_8_20_14_3_00_38_11]
MKVIKYKIIFICFFIFLVFFIIGSRLFWVQIVNYTFFAQEVSKQSKRIKKTQTLRGNIYDRNMMTLATSMTAESCYIETKKAKGLDVEFFSKCTGMMPADIRSKLKQKKNSVLIKRKLLPDEVLKIKSKNFPGVYFEKEQLRFYPENSLASHVVGVVGMDNKGLSGIEYLFDDFLTGISKKYVVMKDGKGREIILGNDSEDENRYVVLTIDSRLQHIAETAIKKAYQTTNAKSLTCIIQNPYTGEILAMASYPSFDPNKKIDPKMLKNISIGDAFEPGSVFKIVTAAAVLEKHPEVLSENFFCENGSYKLAKDVVIHDHEKYGLLSFQDMFAYSSNIGFAKLGEIVGKQDLWQYARSFGFGMNTGIELTGETSGRLEPVSSWSGVSCKIISFGQELSVNALQIINSYSTIANGGLLMEPKIIRAVFCNNKEIQTFEPVKIRRVISPATADIIRKMLEAVVEYGTGVHAGIEGIKIAGKTGTAQKYDNYLKKYSDSKYVSLFAGFFPSKKPDVTVLVIVDEPKGDYWASSVAAPIFRNISSNILEYLDIRQENKFVLK